MASEVTLVDNTSSYDKPNGTAFGTATNPIYTTTSTGAAIPAAIATTNSSATPLGVSGVFTGPWVDVLAYGSIIVTTISDVASGTNGLSIQQSSDGVNADITDTYTVGAGSSAKIVVTRQARYARVVYTNGGTIQASFRLATIFDPRMPRAVSVKPTDTMNIENDMDQSISIQMTYNGSSLDLQRSATNSTNSAGTGIMAASMLAQFDDVTPSAMTENNFGNARMSSDRLLYATPAPTTSVGAGVAAVATSVAAGSLIAKAAAGNLYGFNVDLPTGAVAQKVMLFDATTAPADGAVTPKKVFDIAAASELTRSFSPPIRFTTGCVLVLSTTGPFTKTIALTTNLGFISADIA